MNLGNAVQKPIDRGVLRVFELSAPSDSSAIQFLMRHVDGILKRCWMMVSRTCRGMIAMQKVYGFSRVVVWNLTCSLMNSVRKVRAGIDGKRRRRMLYFLGNWNFIGWGN